MSGETVRRKQFLFVDDDPAFLSGVVSLFVEMSEGRWDIATATNHAQALSLLSQRPLDVVVLDIGMPMMDGVQFLRLLSRTHPGQQVVMLTGRDSEESRKTCLESGAVLYLEKPTAAAGFKSVFAALDTLANSQPQAGFRGVIRRVGLQEVLHMECLARKSSVLEVLAGKVRGRIYISDGAIVHADAGAVHGEAALYGLLALHEGDFNFLTYTEPPRRSISGHWESLLMEAARLGDEGARFFESTEGEAAAPVVAEPEHAATPESPLPKGPPPGHVRVEEVVLCSGSGEVLYERNCMGLEGRIRLMDQIERQAGQLSTLAPLGRFDRLEVLATEERMVCQTQPDRRVFVRSQPRKVHA